ncbi:MAG: hypothetical protein L6Q33_10470 [Bacteriovoracaceae bacterium]|nr:hypothetical protein [Bacteriovoracaceae bacterium]
MNILILLLTMTLGFFNQIALASDQNLCANQIGTCQYYACKEQELGCGPKGYLLNYGQRFCRKFYDELEMKLTATGSMWIQEAATCLQEKIEFESHTQDCKKMRKFAYSSHSNCYSKANFCQLPLEDKVKIIRFLNSELHKFQTQKEGIQVLFNCFQSK